MSKEMKLGIVSGVISSILVIIFIQPLLDFIWKAILSLGEAVQAGYLDKIYKSAALGERNMSSNITLLIQTIFLNWLACIHIIAGKNGTAGLACFANKFRYTFPIVLITLSVMCFLLYSITMGISDLNASFNQRLTILSPFITESEVKEYKAMWVKMRNQGDYRNIVKKMESSASNLKVELPPLRNP